MEEMKTFDDAPEGFVETLRELGFTESPMLPPNTEYWLQSPMDSQVMILVERTNHRAFKCYLSLYSRNPHTTEYIPVNRDATIEYIKAFVELHTPIKCA